MSCTSCDQKQDTIHQLRRKIAELNSWLHRETVVHRMEAAKELFPELFEPLTAIDVEMLIVSALKLNAREDFAE